jgi:hypothetical protein
VLVLTLQRSSYRTTLTFQRILHVYDTEEYGCILEQIDEAVNFFGASSTTTTMDGGGSTTKGGSSIPAVGD